jgi:chromosome segregation ATPase
MINLEEFKAILDEKLAPLKSEISEVKAKSEEMRAFLDMANEKYDEIITKLAQRDGEMKDIKTENKILKATIQTMDDQVRQLTDSVNDLEQYSRRECLEIQGIPLKNFDDTNSIVVNVGELMGINIKEEDISVSHRLPIRSNYRGKQADPTIIVKFVRRHTKEIFYRARKELKNKTSKDLGYVKTNSIYINESLTEKNKSLFGGARRAKKELGYSFICTANGRIFLRKDKDSPAILIKSKDDISNLSRNSR